MRSADHTRCKGKFDGFTEGKFNHVTAREEVLCIDCPAKNLEKDWDGRGCESSIVDGEMTIRLCSMQHVRVVSKLRGFITYETENQVPDNVSATRVMFSRL